MFSKLILRGVFAKLLQNGFVATTKTEMRHILILEDKRRIKKALLPFSFTFLDCVIIISFYKRFRFTPAAALQQRGDGEESF